MPEPCGYMMCRTYHHDSKPSVARQMPQAQNDIHSETSPASAGLGRAERLCHLNSKPCIALEQAIADAIGIPPPRPNRHSPPRTRLGIRIAGRPQESTKSLISAASHSTRVKHAKSHGWNLTQHLLDCT